MHSEGFLLSYFVSLFEVFILMKALSKSIKVVLNISFITLKMTHILNADLVILHLTLSLGVVHKLCSTQDVFLMPFSQKSSF